MRRLSVISLVTLLLSLRMTPAWGQCQIRSCGLTYQQLDGNRLVLGQGSMPNLQPIEIPLPQEPVWVVALAADQGVIWVTVLVDGSVLGFRTIGSEVTPVPVDPPALPIGQPPLLQIDPKISVLTVADPQASDLTHGIPTESEVLFVTRRGDLRLGSEHLSVQALPDARIVGDGSGQWLVLAGADDQRYRHEVLGDRIEATQILRFETQPTLRVLGAVDLDPVEVVEGIAPIWADLDGEPGREVIVTFSDAESGGQIGVLDHRGKELARGPGFDRGNRWRHPLAVAPFGPQGELELAVIRTPHISGVVEFYRLQATDDRLLDPLPSDQLELTIVAQLPGFTSHQIGSRNLDLALAGDLNGDGVPELVVPRQDLSHLGGIQRTPDGAEVVWEMPLAAELTTNLAAVQTEAGIILGAGTQDRLQLWIP